MSSVKFESHLSAVVQKIESTNRRNLTDATVALYREIQKHLVGPRSGKIYKVPGTQTDYTASAPGEPPAKRTGTLALDIKYKVLELLGVIGTDNKYALALEKGTPDMEPRPYFEPAVNKTLGQIKKIMSTP